MSGSSRERGAVMVWALIFVIVTAGMIISHTAYMASHRQTMDVQLKRKPLAVNFARAALTDGLSWFQAQPTQPVATFAPRQDLGVDPPVLDTIDPTVGLVREFEIRGNLWGRYEIRREEVADLSQMYGSAPGSVWRMAARGYVYRRNDAGKGFDQAPNGIVSTSRLETTLRSVPLNLPAPAALDIDDLSRLTIGPGGRIDGGSASPAVAGPPPGSLLSTILSTLSALVTGSPGVLTVPGYKSEPVDVFRMSLAELRDVADLVVGSGSARWLSYPLREGAIVYHDGDLTVTPAQHLNGSMLLVVNGNLVVQAGSHTSIDGVVYVTGNSELRGPFRLDGVLVGKGSVLVQGNGPGQDSVLYYDGKAVQRLLQSLTRYRASRTTRSLDGKPRKSTDLLAAAASGDSAIDPTATVESGATIGDGVQIEEDVRIERYATIGDHSILRAASRINKNALLGIGVEIGRGSLIEDFATIGDHAVLGRNVRIRPGARVAPGAVVPDDTEVRAGTSFP